MKALIVTLFDCNNIGNRLQNYALQYILLKQGLDVDIIDNGYSHAPGKKYTVKMYIKGVLGCLGNEKYKKQYQKFIATKKIRKASYKFNKRNIKNVVRVSTKEAFEKDWSEYDIAFSGSDQVWHKWNTTDDLELPFYYLQFLPQNKRVAYAASFGFEEFPESDLEQHEEGIKGMRYISCREASGCKLVSSVSGKEAKHVLDPTLLLSATEWREIAAQTSECVNQKNYAVVFFLGEKTEEYKAFIKETVEKYGIEKIVDPLSNSGEFKEFGPCEFLNLIDNAKYVFTDSFHCVVFSTIFGKQFTAFRRSQPGMEKMFGRIEGLLSSKGMLDHIYGGTSVEASNDFEELKSRSIKYIEDVLKVYGENRKN